MSDLNLLAILENIDKLDAAASNEFLKDLCKEAAKELVELNALRLRRGTHEPVAWMYTDARGRSVLVETNTSPFEDATPLYAHPPRREWQGLTAEEFDWILNGNRGARAFIKVTEARLKEKNT
jgi:hypothetical protein